LPSAVHLASSAALDFASASADIRLASSAFAFDSASMANLASSPFAFASASAAALFLP